MGQVDYNALQKIFNLSAIQIDELEARVKKPEGWHETQCLNGHHTGQINIAWRIPRHPKAVVIVAQGRAQSAAEWYEFSDHMFDEGYATVIYDPQGQGKSYSLSPDRRHHIDDYMKTEVLDLANVLDIVERQAALADLPKVLVGHSKGGNTALRYMAMNNSTRHQFQAAVIISPMTGLQYPTPFLKAISPYAPSLITTMGLGTSYAPSQGALTLERYLNHMENLSSDPVSQALPWTILQQNPEMICHGPTWGFVHEAQKSFGHLRKPGVIESIETPTFWIIAGQEKINDNKSMIDIYKRMQTQELLLYMSAQHQVHMERPEIKDPMYGDLKNFLRNHLSL